MIVDGLDEAVLQQFGDDGTIVDILAMALRKRQIPSWLHLVATSRPESKVARVFQGLDSVAPLTLDALVRKSNLVQSEGIGACTFGAVVTGLNFLCCALMCRR